MEFISQYISFFFSIIQYCIVRIALQEVQVEFGLGRLALRVCHGYRMKEKEDHSGRCLSNRVSEKVGVRFYPS